MTPQELDRKVEFIIDCLARLAAGQEQYRQDRLEFEKQAREMDARLARVVDQQTQLMVRQSERIDYSERRIEETETRIEQTDRRIERSDKLYDDWLHQNREFQQQALRLLNMILNRLPPFSQNGG